MSVKRKASFPIIELSSGTAIDTGLDSTPKHLNSRTRKRFRNDRPNDEVVYENTLRWLFSAQQQTPPIHSQSEDMTNLEPLLPPENGDPRQHTLLKFFKPVRPSLIPPPLNVDVWKSGDSLANNSFGCDDPKATASSIGSNTNSPSPQRVDTSADLSTEMDSGSDESAQDSKKWVGGLGWL